MEVDKSEDFNLDSVSYCFHQSKGTSYDTVSGWFLIHGGITNSYSSVWQGLNREFFNIQQLLTEHLRCVRCCFRCWVQQWTRVRNPVLRVFKLPGRSGFLIVEAQEESKLFWGGGFHYMIRPIALKDPRCMPGIQLCFPFLGRQAHKTHFTMRFRISSLVCLYPVLVSPCLSSLTLPDHSVSLAFKLGNILRPFLLWFIYCI